MDEKVVREQVVYLLSQGGAHQDMRRAVNALTFPLAGIRPSGLAHSIWELLEHMRIAQEDIIEFTLDGSHQSPPFPEGYWPKSAAPADEEAFEKAKKDFLADLERAIELAKDESLDITGPVPRGSGQTVLRELLLIADHNSYHLGQIIDVYKLTGASV